MNIELDIDIAKLAADIAQELGKTLRQLTGQVQCEDDALFTVQSLAKYLEVSPQWIYERVQLKEIPHIKVGKFPRFRKTDIKTWLNSQRVPVTQPLSKRLQSVK